MTPKYITENQDLITTVENFIAEWHSSSELICVNTSGSTGIPKTIKLRKKHMIASAKATGQFLNLKSGNTALLSMSPKTIGGMMMIVRSIFFNLELIVVDASSTPLTGIKSKIDFAALVPLQVKETIAVDKNALSIIGTLIIGGGPINESLENELLKQSTQIFHTYGMTETISHVALRNISNRETFFKALPGVQISTIDKCLNISSENIGVRNLQTNDIIELIDETTFKWLGRSDFAINSGGIKIIPTIIESKLSSLIKDNFFSTGLADETLGQKHVILIESQSNIDLTVEDFQVLEKYKRPKEIYYLKEFIRTESGKIDRNKTLGLLLNAKKQVL